MSFMKPDITRKQSGWAVETEDGTSFIPSDVVAVPAILTAGVVLTADCPDGLFSTLEAMVQDCVSGSKIYSIEVFHKHHFARLSAPGYTDCTDWAAFKTLREAREYLTDNFGDE